MSQENVEIARQAHEAFGRPDLDVFDLDALYRYADPDLVVDWSRSHGDRVVVEPLEFIDHRECVVVPHHLRARGRNGVQVEAHSTTVFTIREGRIVELRLYRDRADALKAVGLEG
jgi:hypothetical protein